MRITALKPQKKHPERVNVYVDGEFRCGLALEIVQQARLRVGATVEEPSLVVLERRDLAWKAREAALHLLSFRARTRAELRRRLLRKEFPQEVVDACVDDLADRGFLDDAAFAESFVRDRVRLRPRGRRRLLQELRAKGVAREVAEPVIEEVLEAEEVSETDLALEAAEDWARRNLGARIGRPDEDPWKLRSRLYGYLARRGFAGDAIRTASARVLEEDGGGD